MTPGIRPKFLPFRGHSREANIGIRFTWPYSGTPTTKNYIDKLPILIRFKDEKGPAYICELPSDLDEFFEYITQLFKQKKNDIERQSCSATNKEKLRNNLVQCYAVRYGSYYCISSEQRLHDIWAEKLHYPSFPPVDSEIELLPGTQAPLDPREIFEMDLCPLFSGDPVLSDILAIQPPVVGAVAAPYAPMQADMPSLSCKRKTQKTIPAPPTAAFSPAYAHGSKQHETAVRSVRRRRKKVDLKKMEAHSRGKSARLI